MTEDNPIYAPPFSKAEYDRRLAETKNRMADAGFDLIICQDPANMGWLTGFDGWSFYTPQVVLVHLDEEPIWFGRTQDAKAAHITTDILADNIVGYSEQLIHHATGHPYDELADLIKERGWASSRIGVELDAHYYTARAHAHLVKGVPDANVSDSEQLVNWARLIKSEAELVYMREAGAICTAAMNRAIEKVAPGVAQYEVIAEVYSAQILGVKGAYGDYTGLCPLIQVGEGTSTPHLTWSDKPIPRDTLVMLEMAGARHHYHAPLTRTLFLGSPPSEVTALTRAIIEGVDAALDMARPGVTCEAVEAVWQKVLNQAGYHKDSRVGYSVGLNYPPDWGERTASLRPGDQTVLQSGMCFHFQSGVWLETLGAAVSESFVVTERGGERLCNVRPELIVID
ncbi:MAG: M24 family metallopeptidase [Pseudomonadota bacterium]|nr:M24 family metallopeptidase [Pseudomonadota bacterium]